MYDSSQGQYAGAEDCRVHSLHMLLQERLQLLLRIRDEQLREAVTRDHQASGVVFRTLAGLRLGACPLRRLAVEKPIEPLLYGRWHPRVSGTPPPSELPLSCRSFWGWPCREVGILCGACARIRIEQEQRPNVALVCGYLESVRGEPMVVQPE